MLLSITLRSIGLLSLFPVLVDESIYMRWAEIIQHQGQWFISLLDAKQPLSYWIYAILRMIWPAEPLFQARLVSVISGLLSTVGIIGIGRRLGTWRTGALAGLFYAPLPYGVFYDRLAYTDALVNLAGIAIVLASFACFERPRPGSLRPVLVGLALGIGFFIKSTALAFVFVPLLVAIVYRSHKWGRIVRDVFIVYAVASIFPLISSLAMPVAPVFEVNNLLLHHTSFFTPLDVLIRRPWVNVGVNAPLLTGYLLAYVTGAMVIIAGFAVVTLRKQKSTWILISVFAVPVAAQFLMLEYFPSRYVFPHIWPLLVVSALAFREWNRHAPRTSLALGVVAVAAMMTQSALLLTRPAQALHERDAEEFLASGPFSGFGIREAIAYLRTKASGAVILTDPIWGPPADAVFPYLNGVDGIRVYDAWWMQLSKQHPILPRKVMEVLRSQYERLPAGWVDFEKLPSVFYVTDTNYNKPEEVRKREPGAYPTARFPKKNGVDFIDVYKLR